MKQTNKEKRVRGCTLGCYFPGLAKSEAMQYANASMTLISLGYKAERGVTTGEGAAGRLLVAILAVSRILLGFT